MSNSSPKPGVRANPSVNWQDPFLLEQQLSVEEIMTRDAAADFARTVLQPKVREANRAATWSRDAIEQMGKMGLLGSTIAQRYGGSDASYVQYGLCAREIERVDSSYRSTLSVQSSLVMYPIYAYGSPAQRERYLPPLASGKMVGAFGLTEPDYGSDIGNMVTTARRHGRGYLLSGAKSWITNAPVADILLIWAKSEHHDGKICGFLVERDTPGLSTATIDGKFSLRASATGTIALSEVVVPEHNLLPDAIGLKTAFACLNRARYGIAWGAMGAAEACWHRVLDYVMQRKQFGEPLAAKQLVQRRLADMQTDIALGLQAAYRLGRMMDEGNAAAELVSLVKRNNVAAALRVARDGRDLLGGNGIADDYDIIRHMMNLEAVNTYEGTSDIHALILGRWQTGIAAF